MEKLGIVTKEADGFKVVLDRILDHNIETVWDAITNPEKLKIWFTDFEMDYREGGKITIYFKDEVRTATHAEIITIEKPHKFVWTWEGELAVWDLKNMGNNQCELILSYSKMAEQYAVSAPAGFHSLIDQLEAVLNGRKEPYKFGSEINTPEYVDLKEQYGEIVFQSFPELQIYYPYVIDRIINSPVDKVWKAISDKEQMKKWYFDIPEFKLETNHEFNWIAGPPEGNKWQHRGKIVELEVGKKLAYTWEYPGYTGKAIARWELSPADSNHTKLIFTFEFLVPFDPKEEPLQRKNFVEGWKYIINTGLRDFVER